MKRMSLGMGLLLAVIGGLVAVLLLRKRDALKDNPTLQEAAGVVSGAVDSAKQAAGRLTES
jgi:hypothetical protein